MCCIMTFAVGSVQFTFVYYDAPLEGRKAINTNIPTLHRQSAQSNMIHQHVSDGKMDTLEISTLGGLSIQLGAKPVTGLASRKVEALLVYLACTPRPHPREVLAELLWDERSQSRVMSNLRVALSSLRKMLGDFVVITRNTGSINLDSNIWLDTARLELPASSGEMGEDSVKGGKRIDIPQFEQAVALYRGEFLAGFNVRNCRGFENWAVLERERIRAVFENKMQLLLDALLLEQRWLDVIKWGEHWIAYGQTPEPAYRALMYAYSGLGDLSSMSNVYQRCVETLRQDLGIEPSEQTRELFGIMIKGEKITPSSGALTDELPPREADRAVAHLLRRLREQHVEVLDLAGLAVIYASREDLDIGAEEAGVLIRSALHHGLDVEPWLRRVGSPKDAVVALREILEKYPKPVVRLRIVEALKGIEGHEAAATLLQIGLSDDASNVRSEAAVAAASRGLIEEVSTGLAEILNESNDGSALAALVAIADEFELPKEIGPYPKMPVAVSLGRKRWQAQNRNVFRYMRRGGFGGVFMALIGLTAPYQVAIAFPDKYIENLEFMTLTAWMFSGAVGFMLIGIIQGLASGFSLGLADALWRSKTQSKWRVIFGALSGLAHSIILTIFSLMQLANPQAEPLIYIPVNILYGMVFGAAISFVIPPMGTYSTLKEQLNRAAVTGLMALIATIPYVFLVYTDDAGVTLLSRGLFVIALPLALSLVYKKDKPIESKSNLRKA
jgi:DNA-binding SARP family transcriptional activator